MSIEHGNMVGTPVVLARRLVEFYGLAEMQRLGIDASKEGADFFKLIKKLDKKDLSETERDPEFLHVSPGQCCLRARTLWRTRRADVLGPGCAKRGTRRQAGG